MICARNNVSVSQFSFFPMLLFNVISNFVAFEKVVYHLIILSTEIFFFTIEGFYKSIVKAFLIQINQILRMINK